MLNALASALQGSIPATPSIHRLRRGLPGYLILFAPHAFAPQRQLPPRSPPSPPVFLPISTNFTSTPGIPRPSPAFKLAVSHALPRLSQGLSHPTYKPPTSALRPIIPNNARTLCITAAAGTELAGASSRVRITVSLFVPADSALRSEDLHHSRGVAASGFRPLRKIPHCCLP